jgi:hypothetical protein
MALQTPQSSSGDKLGCNWDQPSSRSAFPGRAGWRAAEGLRPAGVARSDSPPDVVASRAAAYTPRQSTHRRALQLRPPVPAGRPLCGSRVEALRKRALPARRRAVGACRAFALVVVGARNRRFRWLQRGGRRERHREKPTRCAVLGGLGVLKGYSEDWGVPKGQSWKG